jgi:hypothetical protein
LGPGYFCGGGYRVALAKGDRALVLPQGQAPQATRFVISGREVNISTGAPPAPGKVVVRYGDTAVTQQDYGKSVAYTVSNETPYGLSITSDAFGGFKHDGWFFTKTNFAQGADQSVPCLSAKSY